MCGLPGMRSNSAATSCGSAGVQPDRAVRPVTCTRVCPLAVGEPETRAPRAKASREEDGPVSDGDPNPISATLITARTVDVLQTHLDHVVEIDDHRLVTAVDDEAVSTENHSPAGSERAGVPFGVDGRYGVCGRAVAVVSHG